MAYYKKLAGEKCYLSPVSLENAVYWTEWLNDLEVALPLGDEAYTIISLDKQREWISNDILKQQHIFSIIDLETDKPIGRCMLFNVNLIDRTATLGIFIGDKAYWNKGYGSDAIELLLDYGFNLLNLHNIMLGTFSFNKRAISCYKKLGFREIGVRRESRIIGSEKYDSILMDMLADEFKSVYVSRFTRQDRA